MKTAVIYWSANAELFAVSEFGGNVADYDAFAFGCPAMGAEVLEEEEFEPFFTDIEGSLSGKKVLLFGSYGWGDGEWMRNWYDRAKAAGAELIGDEGFIVNDAPSDDDLAKLKALAAELA